MPDSHVTAQLDQLAARITAQREQNPPQVAALLDYEQTFMTNLINSFPEYATGELGAVMLLIGAQLAQLATALPESMRPNTAQIIVNVLQMAAERLYTGKPPVTWPCPHLLVGGMPCKTLLTARDDEQLRPRIAGHLDMHHPDNRAERRTTPGSGRSVSSGQPGVCGGRGGQPEKVDADPARLADGIPTEEDRQG